MTICGSCSVTISRNKPCVFCSACKKQVHASCVSEIADIAHLLNTVKGLSWKCAECADSCMVINQADLCNLLDTRIENALSALNEKITSLKSDLCKSARENLPAVSQPRYSDVLKNKTHPAVIVKPKNTEQPITQTKSDVMRHINPIESNIQLSKVKSVKNGGFLIGCKNKEDNEKIKKMVEDKLSDSYEIQEINGINPRVRVVGLTENYPYDQLVTYIKKCNADLFLSNSVCKIIKTFPTKKNKNIFQVILQLDTFTYDKVIKAGNLFVGYDSCSVFDAIEIYRCYKCNEFHHSANNCKNSPVCPLCSENHDLKQCKSKVLCCSNCSKLKDTLNRDIPTNHAVWDKNTCTAYTQARDKLRNDILMSSVQ